MKDIKLPEFGQVFEANLRAIGIRTVYLVNQPDEKRGYFNFYEPATALYCESDECYYSVDLIKDWQHIETKPSEIGCIA